MDFQKLDKKLMNRLKNMTKVLCMKLIKSTSGQMDKVY